MQIRNHSQLTIVLICLSLLIGACNLVQKGNNTTRQDDEPKTPRFYGACEIDQDSQKAIYNEYADSQEEAAPEKIITILGNFTTEKEKDTFCAGLKPFLDQQKEVKIFYEGTEDFITLLAVRAESEKAPDIVIFPQPGFMEYFAREGQLFTLDEVLAPDPDEVSAPDPDEVSENKNNDNQCGKEELIDWLNHITCLNNNNKRYGVWYRGFLKSLVWYDPSKLYDVVVDKLIPKHSDEVYKLIEDDETLSEDKKTKIKEELSENDEKVVINRLLIEEHFFDQVYKLISKHFKEIKKKLIEKDKKPVINQLIEEHLEKHFKEIKQKLTEEIKQKLIEEIKLIEDNETLSEDDKTLTKQKLIDEVNKLISKHFKEIKKKPIKNDEKFVINKLILENSDEVNELIKEIEQKLIEDYEKLSEDDKTLIKRLESLKLLKSIENKLFSEYTSVEEENTKKRLDWKEVQDLSESLYVGGYTPWCIGLEAGESTGWVGTDWIESFMLINEHSPKDVNEHSIKNDYKNWVKHDSNWAKNDKVKSAFDKFSDIVHKKEGRYVAGGTSGIIDTPFYESPKGLFRTPPECYLHRQSSLITQDFSVEKNQQPLDKNQPLDKKQAKMPYDFFLFPLEASGKDQTLLISGEFFSAFKKHPNSEVKDVVKELIKHLEDSYKPHKLWIKKGGFISFSIKNINERDYHEHEINKEQADKFQKQAQIFLDSKTKEIFKKNANNEEKKLITHLVTKPEPHNSWVNEVRSISFINNIEHEITKKQAQIFFDPEINLCFDGSDMMPELIGTRIFWKAMADYVRVSSKEAEKERDNILKQIDDHWSNYKWGKWLEREDNRDVCFDVLRDK